MKTLATILFKIFSGIYAKFRGTYHAVFPNGRLLYSFISILIFVIWSSTSCSATIQFCQSRQEDRRLNATVYRNVSSMSAWDCIALCVVDPCCRAVNHRKTQCFDGTENCEILHEVERELDEEDLKINENYIYHRLNQPTRRFDCHDCSSCENGGTCNDTMKQCSCPSGFVGKRCEKVMSSCVDHYARGSRQDGIYTIIPDNQGPFQVRCDMTTDGGGWTVFQRRIDGSQGFYRNWADYEQGFGALHGEFWLGLDKIHRLSKSGQNVLRIDMEDFDDETRYAKYSSFAIASGIEKYQLTVSGYSGDAGDSLAIHNGMKFTTKDQDNDGQGRNCAVTYTGAWWYKTCHRSNLNGQYLAGPTGIYAKGIIWYTWKEHYYSLKKTEMKTRPERSVPL